MRTSSFADCQAAWDNMEPPVLEEDIEEDEEAEEVVPFGDKVEE